MDSTRRIVPSQQGQGGRFGGAGMRGDLLVHTSTKIGLACSSCIPAALPRSSLPSEFSLNDRVRAHKAFVRAAAGM